MSFAIPVSSVATDTFDKMYTLSCTGADNTPNLILGSAVVLSSDYECALLSADYENLKRADNKRFTIKFKTITMDGPLYVHSGAFDSNKDNVVDTHQSPVYRSFTMASDTSYTNIEFDIVDDSGSPIVGDITYGTSYFNIHIRHKKDHRSNSFIQAVKAACDLVHDAIDESKAAAALQTGDIVASLALIKTACDSVDTSAQEIKASCDFVNDAIDESKAASILNKDAVVASIALVKTACDTIDASAQEIILSVDESKAASILNKDAVVASIALVKTACDTIDTSAQDIVSSVDSAKTSSIANSGILNTALGLIKESCDLVKASTDSVSTTVAAAQTGIELAVSTASTAIVNATDETKAETSAMSAKIRYQLQY
tara:strand:- start:855 stop:1973 length:1119 start_codon:yes stop_codon:yes gene_type:complete